MAAIEAMPTIGELDSLMCGSSFSSTTPTDASSSNSAALSSTPPTTISPDSMSLASEPDLQKPETITTPSVEAAIPTPPAEQHEPDRQISVQINTMVVAKPILPTEPPATNRPRRARASLPVYNISKLIGTAMHRKPYTRGGTGREPRRRTISEGVLEVPENENAAISIDAEADASSTNHQAASVSTPRSARISKKSSTSPADAPMTRRATRLSGAPVEDLTTKLSTSGRRGRKPLEKAPSRMKRELRRLKDTNEFAHIDTRPVRYTVWSKGKYVDVDAQQEPVPEPPRKKPKVDTKATDTATTADTEKQESAAPAVRKPRVKKWLEKGLYAGQEASLDIFKGLTAAEKKKIASLPELLSSGRSNKTFPQPMYNGLRLLITGRDFKLPFDICNPLPPGQPKPAAYRTMTKNRFIGNAAAYWKKTPHFEDFASKCVCKKEDGCDEDCQNRIMLYECDETNCNVGKAHCQNRAFQTLQERTKKGGRYRVGVEVVKTGDRGYGVRSNRCFEPNQIIMEYTGEIITVDECERRMNEVYKDNECYYLMSFDQNMIIDATTGSIARFVNHSCSPNSRMIKWIVSGQPRMALFAGDRPIMTGEELTYDYNFDPFSAKNVQKCLCGSPNCRGVLGPKPKEVKPPKPPKKEKKRKGSRKRRVPVKAPVKAAVRGRPRKDAAKPAVRGRPRKDATQGSTKSSSKVASKGSAKALTKAATKNVSTKTAIKTVVKPAVKRKLKDAFEFDGEDEEDIKATKKRKIKAATGLKGSASLKTAKGAAKGAVTTVKKGISTTSVGAKKKATKSGLATTTTSSKVKLTKSTTTATTKKTKSTTNTVKTGRVTKIHATSKKSTTTATKATLSPPETTKTALTSPSPSLTIVASGVAAVAAATNASATNQTEKTSTPIAKKQHQLPKLTLSSGGKTSARKCTPSRKALEAGVVLGSGIGKGKGMGRGKGKGKAKEISAALLSPESSSPSSVGGGDKVGLAVTGGEAGSGSEVKKMTKIKVVGSGVAAAAVTAAASTITAMAE
ncbi:hypothetical protein N0V88_003475 [Collariella sp. IMI 366227]|nr:hypothetical protein N0V88_003475 [Collariella sp. IMI 366227]